MNKSEEYLKISEEIVNGVGGMDNIQGSAHCATRLRIVLKDNDKADMEKLENINKVKGAFVAGNQLQLIFGAGTVNDVYEVFAKIYAYRKYVSWGIKRRKCKETKPGSGSGKGIVGCIYRNYAGAVGGSASYGTDRCAWRSGSCSKIRYTICDQ